MHTFIHDAERLYKDFLDFAGGDGYTGLEVSGQATKFAICSGRDISVSGMR
jgi:hypothetical protein